MEDDATATEAAASSARAPAMGAPPLPPPGWARTLTNSGASGLATASLVLLLLYLTVRFLWLYNQQAAQAAAAASSSSSSRRQPADTSSSLPAPSPPPRRRAMPPLPSPSSPLLPVVPVFFVLHVATLRPAGGGQRPECAVCLAEFGEREAGRMLPGVATPSMTSASPRGSGSAPRVRSAVLPWLPRDGFVDNNGIVLLLFETPSGFAIFGFSGFHLYKPDAIQSMWVNFAQYQRVKEVVWLKEFQTFDDKFSAINVGTGVNTQLREMIMKWRRPKQTLVVGKREYKSIIESSLGIPCLHDQVVMELMWGMQRHMHRLVPREKSELPKEDRVPMSRGLQMLLSRYGFHVSPEMVNNEQIVLAACALFNCDAAEKEQYPALRYIGPYLNRVSGIDWRNWGALKLATAFKIICTHEIGGSDEMFSKDVQLKLLEDADDYKDLLNEAACLRTYRKLESAHQCRTKNKAILSSLVKKDKEVHEDA